ncbi:MAG: hypothetical protein WDN45_03355 [Caulobacteraceae bacterium]
MRFTVLAKIPELARARTLYDEDTGDLSVTSDAFTPSSAGWPQPRAAPPSPAGWRNSSRSRPPRTNSGPCGC